MVPFLVRIGMNVWKFKGIQPASCQHDVEEFNLISQEDVEHCENLPRRRGVQDAL
jgi:hypothetical protein